jgi:dihydroorotase
MRYLQIENARLIDPANNLDSVTEIFVADGRIQTIGRRPVAGEIEESIDAQGQWLIPGLIDLGGHLPEPGYSQKGSIASETHAACAGGFTHICSLPDTKPVADTAAVIQLVLEKAAKAGFARVLPLGALTQGLAGEQIANMVTLQEAGAVALSNARRPIRDNYVLRRLMEYAATYDIPLFLTANDEALSAGGCMHEGPTATRMGLSGIPETAETIAIAHILLLIEQTGVRAHISQISCARSVAMLTEAHQRGLPVTADTPLANLLYTDEAVEGYNSLFNVQPPLRGERDRQTLLQAVEQGHLAISSNHQPHEIAAKKAPFADAEAGMSQYDHYLPQALTLVHRGELSIEALIRATSTTPANLLGLRQQLTEGADFNACLVDPNAENVVTTQSLQSRGRNHPALGRTLKGQVKRVFVDGQLVFAS